MKFAGGPGVSEEVPKLLAETLSRVGASEIASYQTDDALDAQLRVLTATDLGLADVRITYTERGRRVAIGVTLQPWNRVAARVMVSTRAGMGDRVEAGNIDLSEVEEPPIYRDDGRGREFDEFAAALLEQMQKR
jgi:hypothetical protein